MSVSPADVEEGASASRVAAAAALLPETDMRSELAHHVAWSTAAPHGLRGATESVDAALRRSRMEVLRTVAMMRASEEEFSRGKPSRLAQSSSVGVHLPRCGPRKPLYPSRATSGLFKTMDDLTAAAAAQRAGGKRGSRPALSDAAPFLQPDTAAVAAGVAGTVVRSDPRVAVLDKHRAAVEVTTPQIPAQIERALHDHMRCLGAVKPYGLARRARRGDDSFVAQPSVTINEHYIDRMQCCRPSKGLYVYYE